MSSKGRILVVEDDSVMREELEELLSESGFQVDTATTGQMALRKIKKTYYDLVLSDLVMPEMDGMELLREIKKKRPSLPVIMITAYGTIGIAVEAMKLGAADFISKPFKIEELNKIVARVMEERRLEARKIEVLDRVSEEDVVIRAVANPFRKKILLLMKTGKNIRFTDLKNKLNIDPPLLSYHLKFLKKAGLVSQTSDKFYMLTSKGANVKKMIQSL